MDFGKLRVQAEDSPGRGGLPVLPPLLAIVELSVLLIAILGIDRLFPKLGITELQPNIFWIPILLLSLHYGTVSGLLAAAAAIAAMLLQGVPDQNVGENHFAYLLRIWAEPILWIGVALLLGQFRMRQIERKNELAHQLHEALSQRAAIADYATNLRARCAGLERELAGRTEPPVQQLLATLDQLSSNGIDDDFAAAFSRSIEMAFGDAQASLYLLDGQVLRRTATSRSPAPGTVSGRFRGEIDGGHPLFRSVIALGEAPSVLVRGDEAKLAGEGLAAVPIRATDGSIIGMLKLDDAAPASLGAATSGALQAIAHAAAIGIKRPRAVAAPAAAPLPAEDATTSLRSRFQRSIRLIPTTTATTATPAADDEQLASGGKPSARTVH